MGTGAKGWRWAVFLGCFLGTLLIVGVLASVVLRPFPPGGVWQVDLWDAKHQHMGHGQMQLVVDGHTCESVEGFPYISWSPHLRAHGNLVLTDTGADALQKADSLLEGKVLRLANPMWYQGTGRLFLDFTEIDGSDLRLYVMLTCSANSGSGTLKGYHRAASWDLPFTCELTR